MPNKIYIGFSIDMDGATQNNSEFIEGMNNLFIFFTENKLLSGVNWLINEASFKTTKYYPDIVKKIYYYVKHNNSLIGLHTHFNIHNFNCPKDLILPEIKDVTRGGCFGMSSNRDDWELDGLITPKKNIEQFIEDNFNEKYNISYFKSGDHLRTDSMLSALIDNKYTIDCSFGYERKRVVNYNGIDIIPYDDTNIKFMNGPFIIKKDNGQILEIPEIGGSIKSFEKYIKIINKSKNIYIVFQLHPWQVINSLPQTKDLRITIMDSIKIIKKYYKDDQIVYANLEIMGNNIMKCNDYFFI